MLNSIMLRSRSSAVSTTTTTRLLQARGLSRLAIAKKEWAGRLVVTEEVEHALETGTKGVIALETAIVTHGMPHPANLNTALSLEHIIRQTSHNTVIPATIALLHGRIHIGLTHPELTRLSDPEVSRSSIKVSKRDLAVAVSRGLDGGTTVAGTMALANEVGIEVFVTGGIGGVHRGAQSSMDISADLQQLSKTPMGVICAGAKSILDLGLTLEVLETLGVNVTTIGETNDFPAFYSRVSGFKSPYSARTPEDAARLLYTSLHTLPPALRASQLFATPIPAEYEAQGAKIQQAVEQAVRESIELGVDKRGKEVTPWLLKRVGELTQGKALESNIALIENNARVGAKLAQELVRLKTEGAGGGSSSSFQPSYAAPSVQKEALNTSAPDKPAENSLPRPKILVIGSAAIDVTAQARPSTGSVLHTTVPGSVQFTPGGVARNIAECATKLSNPNEVVLLSAIGTRMASDQQTTPDTFGTILQAEMGSSGMRIDGLIPRQAGRASTAVCNLILGNDGGLIAGIADMDIAETITVDEVVSAIERYDPEIVAFDANLREDVLTALLETCQSRNIDTMFDPTSLPKMKRILSALQTSPPLPPGQRRLLSHFSPNLLEVKELYSELQKSGLLETEEWFDFISELRLSAPWRNGVERLSNIKEHDLGWLVHSGVAQMMVSLLPWVGNLWVKCGQDGLLHLGIVDAARDAKRVQAGARRVEHAHPNDFKDFDIGNMEQPVLRLSHYPPQKLSHIVSSTGAGDSLVGGIVAAVSQGLPIHETAQQGLDAARATLMSERAVGNVANKV